jgi:hypothetical protein
MKLTKAVLLITLLSCTTLLTAKLHSLKKTHSHSHSRKSHSTQPQPALYPVNTVAQFTEGPNLPQNIAETFYGGNPNSLPMSSHFLWKDYKKNQFQTPYFHGVVGPTWNLPVPETIEPYAHISSPVPHGDYSKRIIPTDLLPVTHSASSWDMPKRKDVLQIDLPYGSTHTKESYVDPRFPAKKLAKVVTGTQYHGTGSVDVKANFADNMEPTGHNHQTNNSEFSFIEGKNSNSAGTDNSSYKKKHRNLGKSRKAKGKGKGAPRLDHSIVKEHRAAALGEALDAETRSRRLLYSMVDHPEGATAYALPIELVNKREPDFILHQNNAALENSIESWKKYPQGIRSMHTKPFIPKPAPKILEKIIK